MLFRALRRDAALRCYYEPLHPDLLDHVREAEAADPSHDKSPLYAEYTPLRGRLDTQYDPAFALEHAALAEDDVAPVLQAYLHLLVQSAPEVVLQFNRGFWMSRWLHRQYPDAAFVHLVRDPRSVVWSQFTTSAGRVRMDWPVLGRRFFKFSSGRPSNVFSPHAYYGAYQVAAYLERGREILREALDGEVAAWAHDRLRAVEGALPFVQALALWGAQVRVCHHHAQAAFGDRYLLLRYEDFCRAPARALERLYAHGARALPDAVRAYATSAIHAQRLQPWRAVEGAADRFRDGIENAGVACVLREVGYAIEDEPAAP